MAGPEHRKHKSKPRRRRRPGIRIMLGPYEATKLGVPRFSPHDTFHAIMSLRWPQFFGGAVLTYVVVNLLFACLYRLGEHSVAGAHRFSDYFFFSVETLATVGYGAMSPGSFYGHCLATTEIITGLLTMAVLTSLVFARFSRPTARLLFSRIAVITQYEGVPTLMLRVANQRSSYILEANASVVLVRDVTTSDGHHLTRFFDLKLERARSPMFALSWLIMHRIDESSPLHGINAQLVQDEDLRLAVTLSGIDEVFAASVTARHTYSADDIIYGRRFVDILEEGDDSRHLYIDLSRFHDLVEEDQR